MKMSTFGIHRLDWLRVSKMFPWNAKYETSMDGSLPLLLFIPSWS